MKTVIIDTQNDADAPVPGARRVWWKVNNWWVHKGWLMPEVDCKWKKMLDEGERLWKNYNASS